MSVNNYVVQKVDAMIVILLTQDTLGEIESYQTFIVHCFHLSSLLEQFMVRSCVCDSCLVESKVN